MNFPFSPKLENMMIPRLRPRTENLNLTEATANTTTAPAASTGPRSVRKEQPPFFPQKHHFSPQNNKSEDGGSRDQFLKAVIILPS